MFASLVRESHIMRLFLSVAAASAGLAVATPAVAQFSPSPNPVTTAVSGQRTLSSGTGTVQLSSTITTAGGTVAVVMSGTSTLDNAGLIQQTGTGRVIDNTAAGSVLSILNSGTIAGVSTDGIRVNVDNQVTLTNSGTIAISAGGQAVDWANIATKSNALTNTSTGLISSVGEDAVRPGQNGSITNAGTIRATPIVTSGTASGSDGIDLRTEKTVTVTNSGLISGRSGIATDGANVGPSALTVTNNAGGVVQGVNGSGLNVDANTALPSATTVTANVTNAAGATIRGGMLATTTDGDGDGIDIDGVLTLNNAGDVLGLGAKGGSGFGNNAEGIAAGGGSITNTATGRIIGSSLTADAPNGDPTRGGNGILIDDSNGGSAVAATTISNAGLIEGKGGFAVKMNGSFANSVTNDATGTLRGTGATAAVQTGDGADTVVNRGTITGTGGKAIDLQGGNDRLTVQGAGASITGNISGGTGTNVLVADPGAGNTTVYGGEISNFSTVQVKTGTLKLTGTSTYTGETHIDAGATLQLDGADRLSSSSALFLDGGRLLLSNTGAANGQTFASLGLTDNSIIDLGFTSSLTFNGLGTVGLGKTLSILHYNPALSLDYVIRFLGDLTLDSGFLALIGGTTIDGHTAGFVFDGQYTLVEQVPEPATLAVLGFGLAGLAAARRRTRLPA